MSVSGAYASRPESFFVLSDREIFPSRAAWQVANIRSTYASIPLAKNGELAVRNAHKFHHHPN